MADQEFLASGPVSVAPAMNLLSAVAGLALLLGTAALRPDNAYAQEINFDQINKFESLGTGTLYVGAPPKTIINDGKRHVVILTIWGCRDEGLLAITRWKRNPHDDNTWQGHSDLSNRR